MEFQEELFYSPVRLTSERFLNRLASVLTARGGASHSDAYQIAYRAVDGTSCGCCGAQLRVYKRGINAGQVKILRNLASRFKIGEAFRSKDIDARGGDYAKLVAFDLLRKLDDSMWSLTPVGYRFAIGVSPAARFAYFFLGELVGLSVESVKVTLQGHKFRLDSISPSRVEMAFIR